MGYFPHLCLAAAKIGIRPELFAGKVKYNDADAGAPLVEWRRIVELRLTHESGLTLASEKMGGIADLERAAKVLTHYVES